MARFKIGTVITLMWQGVVEAETKDEAIEESVEYCREHGEMVGAPEGFVEELREKDVN